MKSMKSLIFTKNTGLKLTEIDEAEFQKFCETKENSKKVVVEVHYSGINYKDALGACGAAPIFKSDPIIPGIDMAGVALTGTHKGHQVIAQACNLGEVYDGGYTQKALVDESLLIPMPEGLTPKESMVLGTAGLTAALAFYRMEKNGQTPDKGPILVSGATGGVGGFATQIFSQMGYEVNVVTHRKGFEDHLKKLGAKKIFLYEELFTKKKPKPLEAVKWGGVIDNLGAGFLESVLPQVELWGNVCSIGLAKGASFNTTVMPFILRGVSLLGISSNNCTMDVRKDLWGRLGSDLKPNSLLDSVSLEVKLEGVLKASEDILGHKSSGRVLVDVKSS